MSDVNQLREQLIEAAFEHIDNVVSADGIDGEDGVILLRLNDGEFFFVEIKPA